MSYLNKQIKTVGHLVGILQGKIISISISGKFQGIFPDLFFPREREILDICIHLLNLYAKYQLNYK